MERLLKANLDIQLGPLTAACPCANVEGDASREDLFSKVKLSELDLILVRQKNALYNPVIAFYQ